MATILQWYDQVERELENWSLRRVFSDWLDENDEPVLANGQRWQADNEKRPLLYQDVEGYDGAIVEWLWYHSYGGPDNPWYIKCDPILLPAERRSGRLVRFTTVRVLDEPGLAPDQIWSPCMIGRYATLADAEAALAEALQLWKGNKRDE